MIPHHFLKSLFRTHLRECLDAADCSNDWETLEALQLMAEQILTMGALLKEVRAARSAGETPESELRYLIESFIDS